MLIRNHLSSQERAICSDRVDGLTYKAIADKRHIAISTVKTHLGRVFSKLHVTSSLDLQKCLRNSLSQQQLTPIAAKIKSLLTNHDRRVAQAEHFCRISNDYLAESNAWLLSRRQRSRLAV
jgi:DNA-binding CsgD family transcriptional regulator